MTDEQLRRIWLSEVFSIERIFGALLGVPDKLPTTYLEWRDRYLTEHRLDLIGPN